MILIYTGEGKGKTCACVGQAVRATGQGLRVAFAQFMKRSGLAGEQKVLERMLGENFFAAGAGFYRDPSEYDRHRQAASKVLDWAFGKLEQNCLDMVILDEALYALGGDLVHEYELQDICDRCQEYDIHLVLSGRGLPEWLEHQADIISSIQDLRHHFAAGNNAEKGIEF